MVPLGHQEPRVTLAHQGLLVCQDLRVLKELQGRAAPQETLEQ